MLSFATTGHDVFTAEQEIHLCDLIVQRKLEQVIHPCDLIVQRKPEQITRDCISTQCIPRWDIVKA